MSDPRSKPVPAAWRGPLDQWATAMAAAAMSVQSIATRTDHLRRIARALGGSPWRVTTRQLTTWSGRQVWARETRRSVHTSARLFWAWALDAGATDHNPAAGLPRVKAADPAPRPCPTPLAVAAIQAADARSALILRCALVVGLRRGEIAQIHRNDLVGDLVGWSLLVHGKGGRDRIVPLPDDLAADLRAVCRAGGGWAFPGRIDGHLSARRVGELATATLPGVWTLHTLRHGCATRVHNATHDLIAVQQLLGHASVATTQRYVATDQARLRAAVQAGLAPPDENIYWPAALVSWRSISASRPIDFTARAVSGCTRARSGGR